MEELFLAQGHLLPEDADVERETAYGMAVECESRLGHMEEDLRGMGRDLMAAQESVFGGASSSKSSASAGNASGVAEVVEVMNRHYEMLGALEGAVRKVQGDLDMVGRAFGSVSGLPSSGV